MLFGGFWCIFSRRLEPGTSKLHNAAENKHHMLRRHGQGSCVESVQNWKCQPVGDDIYIYIPIHHHSITPFIILPHFPILPRPSPQKFTGDPQVSSHELSRQHQACLDRLGCRWLGKGVATRTRLLTNGRGSWGSTCHKLASCGRD